MLIFQACQVEEVLLRINIIDSVVDCEKLSRFCFLVLINSVQQSSSPVSTQRRDDEAIPDKNGLDPTHSPRTVAVVKHYEKRVNELEHEVTILQHKVRELEAQSLRKDKEAAEALVAAYKENLMFAKELIKSRPTSPGSGKKKKGGPETPSPVSCKKRKGGPGGEEDTSAKKQKT